MIGSTDISPFKYGKTVSGKAFTDRKSESAKIRQNLISGINTIIISPRRWGKSSLVEKVLNTIKRKDKAIITVSIDMFSVASNEEFLQLFAKSVIQASSSRWEEWAQLGKELFKQLSPKINIGIEPESTFSIDFDWKELKDHPDEILQLPEKIAQKKNVKMVVCIDEFQQLATFRNYEQLAKKMRSIWQRQKSVAYCLYGSKRHMMTELFNKSSKPFYKFGEILFLQKIPTEDWKKYIVKAFKSTGKKIPAPLAEKIAHTMENHSWYVQQFAHFLWNRTTDIADEVAFDLALIELINANSPLFQREIEIRSTTQVNLLKAVISGEMQLTSVHAMQTYRLGTPGNVSKNKNSLIEDDILHEQNQQLDFLDPIFALWFADAFKIEQGG